jgi:HK97 family phage portal protein
MSFWDRIKFGRSRIQELLTERNTNAPVYPDNKSQTFYRDAYVGNGDVFTIINKIVEPAARVPIMQVSKKTGEEKAGKAMELLERPNPFQSRTEFIEAALAFFAIFGNTYIAGDVPEFGLRAGQVTRLDILPPQWVEIILGTFKEPILGYKLSEAYENEVDYTYDQVLHWKEFNPNFNIDGTHLYGMSRLKPLIKQITASQAAYDSMVGAFQNMGAYGVLTILGVKDGDRYRDAPQTSSQLEQATKFWRKKWTGADKMGSQAITNKSVEWTPFGMSVQDMSILESIPISRGVICDAYNVPEVLLANSQGRTYDNYIEAQKALWNNAIIPNVDGFLQKLTNYLMPRMGEDDTEFIANYDDIPALQADKKELVDWMVRAGLTGNEIREALGYEPLPIENMDVPMVSLGTQRIDEVGMMPAMEDTEKTLDKLGIKDYREN